MLNIPNYFFNKNTGPDVTTTICYNSSELWSNSNPQTGPFVVHSPATSTFNQQLWFSVKISTDFGES